MDTVQLKSDLFQLISETNDPKILQKIKDFYQSIKEQSSVVQKLSEEERKLMDDGLLAIKNGNVFSNDVVRSEINQWINQRR